MAKMIPNKAYVTGSEGEERIFSVLQTLLPNDYTVLHSLRWIGSNRRRSQGEADFVVFHPKQGVLVIEVKAGTITLDANRRWYQENRNTHIKKEIFDPEKQADESRYKLIDVLKGLNCMVCHAVWFPSVYFSKNSLPPNYHSDMLLDVAALSNPKKAIIKAFSFWSNQLNWTTDLNKTQAEQVIHKLAPTLNLLPSLKFNYENSEERFVQLTKEQTKVLDFLQVQNKATISGAAGTGKTFIAIEKARRLQEEGRKVLFLCYNRLLSEFLKTQYSHYGIHISTFDSLAWKHIGEQKDYNTTRSLFLDYLIDTDNEFDFTDIVIDEGQDFSSEWLEYLEYRLNEDAHFYVFYDQQQCLYTNDINKWLQNSPCRLTLFTNCRNTEAIAKTSYGCLGEGISKQPNLSGVEGEQAQLVPFTSVKQLSKWIDKTVNQFIQRTKTDWSNVAILTMETTEKSILKEVISFSKLNCSEAKTAGFVCRTTSKKFKGLEADLVIITDLDWSRMDDITYRKLFYTSCSRAKHKLYIISPNIETIDIDFVLKHTQSKDSKRKGKRRFLKLFNLKQNAKI